MAFHIRVVVVDGELKLDGWMRGVMTARVVCLNEAGRQSLPMRRTFRKARPSPATRG
jgi:hypothetical protein